MNEARFLGAQSARQLLLASVFCAAAVSGFALWDPLDIDERARRPRVAPANVREVLHSLIQLHTKLPNATFIIVGLLGTLLVTIHVAATARARAAGLQRAHEDLQQRVKLRTLEALRTTSAFQNEIAERARAEAALRQLTGRVLQLQDEERRRIARELHDSTGGLLTGLSFNLEKMQRLAEHTQDFGLAEVTRDSADLLGRVTAEIRTLSHLLYPPLLDELGLEHVLPWYVAGFAKRSGIRVTCDLQPNLGIPQELGLTLFRIVQEALTNIHRHAGSTSASVAVRRDGSSVSTHIQDQGRGIPPSLLQQIVSSAPELGVGIAGMRERVRQFGGRFDLTASASGTIVRVTIPIMPVADNLAEPAPPSNPTPLGRTAA